MTAFEALMGELDAERERDQALAGIPLSAVYTPPSEGHIHIWRGAAELATPWGVRADGAATTAEALLRPWLLGARWFEIGGAAVEAPAASADQAVELSDEITLAQALFDGLGERLGHHAETARAVFAMRISTGDWRAQRETVQRQLTQVAAVSELQIVLVPSGGLTLEQHTDAGMEIIGASRHPLELEISAAVLGAAELDRLSEGESALAAIRDPELRFEDAVAICRAVAERAELADVRFGLRLDGSAPSTGSGPGSWGAEVLPAVAELGRRLSDRWRARLPMSVALPNAAVQLPELAAAGLLPVITAVDELAELPPSLAALTDAMDEHGAKSLGDFACRRALATELGKPFRRRVREHAEADGGVCLRDRQWVAAWQAFEGGAGSATVSERVRRALTAADLAPARAAEVAAQVESACHRVNRASYADALGRR